VSAPGPDDPDRPPLPFRNCPTCGELDLRRERARADYDRSAETDANVLLRKHRREAHDR
jgi:hypothetical protein